MDKKQFLREFYEEVFNTHNVKAAEKYLAEDYIQHNPDVQPGRDGFIRTFEEKFRTVPSFRVEIKRILVDGDMAVVHIHGMGVPGKMESAVADFYRFENDLLAEHWDVVMPIPEHLIGNNNLF